MTPHKSMEEFAKLARAWAPAFRERITTFVALKTVDGKWALRYCVNAFVCEPIPARSLDVETASIKAIRQTVPLNDSSAISDIEEVLSNPMQITFGTEVFEMTPGQNLSQGNFHFHPMYPPRLQGPQRLPALQVSLTGYTPPVFPRAELIDLELYAHHTPFEGLQDLLIELQIPMKPNDVGHQAAVIEHIISPPAKIEPASALSDGTLNLRLSASKQIDPIHIQVGIKTFSAKDAPARTRVSGENMTWSSKDELQIGAYTCPLDNVPIAAILLSYRGDYLGKWLLRDSLLSLNDRLQVHRTIDGNDAFKTNFFSESPDSFEDRIALLLSLLGLNTWKYGGMAALTDAPDMLAITPQNHVFVIECTTGDINRKGKLHQLYTRTKHIKDSLQNSTIPISAIQAAMVTTLRREETSAHWDTAASYRIALICREELETLLSQLDSPPTSDQIYQSAVSCIPRAKSDEPDLFNG